MNCRFSFVSSVLLLAALLCTSGCICRRHVVKPPPTAERFALDMEVAYGKGGVSELIGKFKLGYDQTYQTLNDRNQSLFLILNAITLLSENKKIDQSAVLEMWKYTTLAPDAAWGKPEAVIDVPSYEMTFEGDRYVPEKDIGLEVNCDKFPAGTQVIVECEGIVEPEQKNNACVDWWLQWGMVANDRNMNLMEPLYNESCIKEWQRRLTPNETRRKAVVPSGGVLRVYQKALHVQTCPNTHGKLIFKSGYTVRIRVDLNAYKPGADKAVK